MEKGFFTLEGEIIVEGVHNPQSRWNGWAMPLLPLASVVKVAEWLESIGAEIENGGFPVVIDGVPHWKSLDEMTETTVETHRIDPTVIDGVEYFSIGAGGWCWDEYTPPCEACRMVREEDEDMTEEQARTAYLNGVELCGDCQAYFGLGEWVDSLKGGN
jgi:hypothetical protein